MMKKSAKNKQKKLPLKSVPADNTAGTTEITVSDIAPLLLQAAAQLGCDGKGTDGVVGFFRMCGAKNPIELFHALSKAGQQAMRMTLPAWGARENLMHGYSIHQPMLKDAREEFVGRILSIASRMAEPLPCEVNDANSGYMSGRLPGKLYKTGDELMAALAELDREEAASR